MVKQRCLQVKGNIILVQRHVCMVHAVANLAFFANLRSALCLGIRVVDAFQDVVLMRIHYNLPCYKAEQ